MEPIPFKRDPILNNYERRVLKDALANLRYALTFIVDEDSVAKPVLQAAEEIIKKKLEF